MSASATSGSAGPLSPRDRRFLGLALELARKGMGGTSPNPMVGALVVTGGEILGRGYHQRAGQAHAEIAALDEAGERARGAELYVSLEPCGHQGRTPPCVPRIVAAGIRRVVAAAIDPNPLVDGRGFRALIAGGVDVAPIDALFAKAAARLNEVFVRTITSGRPFVALKAGMTLDGKIAAPSGQSRWVTSEESRAAGRALRERYDATLVGIGTALADDPLLLPAACRIVIDPRLRLPAGSRLAASAREAPVLVYAAEEASREAAAALEAAGVTIVRAERGRPTIEAILEDLGRRAVASVLVEGGGETLGHFLRGGYADRLHLFIAPRLLGGRGSIAAFAGPPPSALEDALALEIDAVRAIGEDLLIEARPRRTETT